VTGHGVSILRGFALAAAASAKAQESPAPLALVPEGIELASAEYIDPNGVHRRDEAQLLFDEDVTRVAFVGWRRGRPVGVADGSEVDGFDYLTVAAVPPAGQPIRFRAGNRTGKKTEKWWVVADGKKSGAEDWLGTLATSRDGSACAYWVQPGARLDDSGAYARGSVQFAFNGKRGGKWDEADALTEPCFSPFGDRVATAATKGGEWHVLVVSGKGEIVLDEAFAMIGDVAWRPDGGELAYAAAPIVRSSLRHPRTDRGNQRERVDDALPTFQIVVGESRGAARTLGAELGSCGCPVWSPDGKQVAYKYLGDGGLGIALERTIVAAPFASALGTPVFSPDGRQVAAAAQTGGPAADKFAARRDAELAAGDGHWFLVIDGKRISEHDRVADPLFAPDGSAVAFAAKRAGHWRIVVGEQESSEFDAVGPPHFNADGSRVIFGARLGREIRREVLVLQPKKGGSSP